MLAAIEILKYDAIYSRQSVDKEDSLSIQTQIDIAKPFCQNEIRYYSDPGWSGGTMNRPDLNRLIQDIKKGIINKIVVYRLDRLSRTSMAEFFSFIEFLTQHKVGFISATEPFDTTTPMGEYMMMTLAGIARLERQNIAARISDNVAARVIKGHWISGPSPYGFDIVKVASGYGKVTSLKANNDLEATLYIVNTYYYEEDSSLGTIRDYLNENNILTAKGKRWSRPLVRNRLYNAAPVRSDLNLYRYFRDIGYVITSPPELWTGEKGCLLVKKKDGSTRASVATWDGYIDSDVWIGGLEKAKRKKKSKKRGVGKLSWLLGLCRCGYCGYCLTGSQYMSERTGKKRRYAYCSQHIEKNCKKETSYDFEEIEAMVQLQLVKMIEKSKDNQPVIGQAHYAMDPQKQLRLIKLEEELGNFIKIIGSGNVNDTTMRILCDEIEKRTLEKERIQEELEEERRQQIHVPAFDFAELDFEEKKMVARAYIKAVSLYDKDHIEIEWNI